MRKRWFIIVLLSAVFALGGRAPCYGGSTIEPFQTTRDSVDNPQSPKPDTKAQQASSTTEPPVVDPATSGHPRGDGNTGDAKSEKTDSVPGAKGNAKPDATELKPEDSSGSANANGSGKKDKKNPKSRQAEKPSNTRQNRQSQPRTGERSAQQRVGRTQGTPKALTLDSAEKVCLQAFDWFIKNNGDKQYITDFRTDCKTSFGKYVDICREQGLTAERKHVLENYLRFLFQAGILNYKFKNDSNAKKQLSPLYPQALNAVKGLDTIPVALSPVSDSTRLTDSRSPSATSPSFQEWATAGEPIPYAAWAVALLLAILLVFVFQLRGVKKKYGKMDAEVKRLEEDNKRLSHEKAEAERALVNAERDAQQKRRDSWNDALPSPWATPSPRGATASLAQEDTPQAAPTPQRSTLYFRTNTGEMFTLSNSMKNLEGSSAFKVVFEGADKGVGEFEPLCDRLSMLATLTGLTSVVNVRGVSIKSASSLRLLEPGRVVKEGNGWRVVSRAVLQAQ